jgi:hypothetical protein
MTGRLDDARTRTRSALRRRGALPGALLGVTLALAACSAPSTEVPEPDPVTIAPTIDVAKVGAPAPVVPPTWPLTGVAGEPAPRPALAVKIENTATARPQSGLDQADVVWETIVEFDVSRFVAVFHSQVPDEVGPIRSVRPMDPAITAPLHGLLAYSGGQPGILDLVAASGVQQLSHDAGVEGMYRIRTRSAPHNVYGSPATFWGLADGEHQAPPAEQFEIARSAERSAAVVAGTPAGTLSFSLSPASRPSWTWDGAAWLRSEDGTPATAASGARIAAANVVSVVADHPGTGFGAQNGAIVPTYTLVGSGDATVASGGKVVAARWQKDSESSPMRLLLADGSPARLAPGSTWVELVPAGQGSLTVG